MHNYTWASNVVSKTKCKQCVSLLSPSVIVRVKLGGGVDMCTTLNSLEGVACPAVGALVGVRSVYGNTGQQDPLVQLQST